MLGNWNISGLYMKKGDFGWGVYTKNKILKGRLIERAIMYRLNNVDGNENPHLFTWSDDRKTWAGGSGFTPFYNHWDNPNIEKVGDLEKDTLSIYAARDIEEDEELLGKYFSKEWRKCFKEF